MHKNVHSPHVRWVDDYFLAIAYARKSPNSKSINYLHYLKFSLHMTTNHNKADVVVLTANIFHMNVHYYNYTEHPHLQHHVPTVGNHNAYS